MIEKKYRLADSYLDSLPDNLIDKLASVLHDSLNINNDNQGVNLQSILYFLESKESHKFLKKDLSKSKVSGVVKSFRKYLKDNNYEIVSF